jgi:hypothetical protein
MEILELLLGLAEVVEGIHDLYLLIRGAWRLSRRLLG